MNDFWTPGGIAYVDAIGQVLDPRFCNRHYRRLGPGGFCFHCQREAIEQAQERAQTEVARQIAVAGECADRATMWGLG